MNLNLFSLLVGCLPKPIELKLADSTILTINEVVRLVPNKRLVCRAFWQGEAVYAKLFIGADASKYAIRDKQGVEKLVNANIATPALLNASFTDEAQILIFQAIPNNGNAEDSYKMLLQQQQNTTVNHAKQNYLTQQASCYEARLGLMQAITIAVARLHQANLLQTDLYLKNFLVNDGLVYTLDGDGIRSCSVLFKHHQKSKNLATLFSKMDAIDDDWIAPLYVSYCEQTGCKYSPFDYTKIWSHTQTIRRQAASNYADKKVFRTCTDVAVHQNTNEYIAVSNSFIYENQSIENIDALLLASEQRIKSGNTCTVAMADIAGNKVVIKRYNIRNFWHGLKRGFKQSRAAKSWANAHRLKLLDIATPAPLALLEQRFWIFKKRTYFIAQYVDAPDIKQFFSQNIEKSIKEQVAYKVALLFYKLSLLNISHGDCKASNIKIADLKPVLLDLDSMRAHSCAWWFERKHIKDLKRFMQNWKDDAQTTAIFKEAFELAYDETDDFQLASLLERAGIA